MPDYGITVGRTYVAASGTSRINGSAFEVRKFTPSEKTREVKQVHAFGSAKPVALVRGPEVDSTVKVTIALATWVLIDNALPDWWGAAVDLSFTYTEERLGPSSIEHRDGMLTKIAYSEADGAGANEILVDIEVQPLKVERPRQTA